MTNRFDGFPAPAPPGGVSPGVGAGFAPIVGAVALAPGVVGVEVTPDDEGADGVEVEVLGGAEVGGFGAAGADDPSGVGVGDPRPGALGVCIDGGGVIPGAAGFGEAGDPEAAGLLAESPKNG